MKIYFYDMIHPFHGRAQVIGWPPVRSFRKNTLVIPSKDNNEDDGKQSPSALFVKVSMDGAPYLRKVDLRNYSKYYELSVALEKMFSGFTIGEHLMAAPHLKGYFLVNNFGSVLFRKIR